MTTELLHHDGCPSSERAWTELGRALATAGIDADVRLRHFDTFGEKEGGRQAWTSIC